MNATALIRTVLWKDLFRVSRTAPRSEFWWGHLCLVIFALLLAMPIFCLVLMVGVQVGVLPFLASVLFLVGVGWGMTASITLTVRRIRDLGLSGWWYLALLALPFVVALLWIVLAALTGSADFLARNEFLFVIVSGGFYDLGACVIGLWPAAATGPGAQAPGDGP